MGAVGAGSATRPAANRNSGARQAIGEWLLFLDDDCIALDGWLEAYASATSKFPEHVVFEGRTVATQPRTHSDQESPVNSHGGLLWSCNFGIKRRLYLEIGGFDEKFPFSMEDMDFQIRLKQAGCKSKFLAEACAEHPWRPRRGAHFCLAFAESVEYFIAKHPETRSIFADTWGLKRIVKIVVCELPRNLLRYRDINSFRVFYLDLLTAVCINLVLARNKSGS